MPPASLEVCGAYRSREPLGVVDLLELPDADLRVDLRRVEPGVARLRSWMTANESRLWSYDIRRQLGAQFRRQGVVGGMFVADFLATEARTGAGRGCCATSGKSTSAPE